MTYWESLKKNVTNRILRTEGTKGRVDRYIAANKHKTYNNDDEKPGDISIDYRGNRVGHASLFAADTTYRIHSIVGEVNGVNLDLMTENRNDSLVFRFKNSSRGTRYSNKVALDAAMIAEQWCGKTGYSRELGESGGPKQGVAIERQKSLLFGCSYFGEDANRRMEKYKLRRKKADAATGGGAPPKPPKLHPKNVTCAEMVVLAYQLSLPGPHRPDFMSLDPKSTSPSRLMRYLIKSEYWEFVGKRTVAKPKQPARIDEDWEDEEWFFLYDEEEREEDENKLENDFVLLGTTTNVRQGGGGSGDGRGTGGGGSDNEETFVWDPHNPGRRG